MTITQSHYFIAPVEVLESETVTSTLPFAVVSRHGIYRAFTESEYMYERFLQARLLTIKIDGLHCLGRLVRVRGKDSSHYNVKLIHAQGEAQAVLEQKLQEAGHGSPKQRRYPRIAIDAVENIAEVPKGVVLTTIVGTKNARVIDFSFSGLHIEFFCGGQSLNEHIGQQIHFDIVTNKGHILYGARAKIVRIYDEMIAPGQMLRRLGLKFDRFSQVGRRDYLEMILNARAQSSE